VSTFFRTADYHIKRLPDSGGFFILCPLGAMSLS
jgi:hypothetical protein